MKNYIHIEWYRMVGVGGIGMSITGSVSQIGTSAFCAGGTVRIAIDAI